MAKLNESIGFGIIFDSREAVENYKKYLQIHNKLKNLANRLNDNRDTKEYWKDDDIAKFCLKYNHRNNRIWLDDTPDEQGNDIYCLEPFKDEAIKEIGEEDLKWYLQQSY